MIPKCFTVDKSIEKQQDRIKDINEFFLSEIFKESNNGILTDVPIPVSLLALCDITKGKNGLVLVPSESVWRLEQSSRQSFFHYLNNV